MSTPTFQGLSEQELAELREVFDMMDKDKGGSLGVEDIKQLMDLLGMKLRMEDVERMVADIDEDGSGEVEFDEFVKVMTKKTELPYSRDDVLRAFRILAPQGANGIISKKDLEALLLKYCGSTIGEDEILRLLSGWDCDEKGNVDYAAKVGMLMP